MSSESLEMRVEDERVSRSWCMCVVSHGYGGFGWGSDGGVGFYACGKCLVACREMQEYFLCVR